MHGTSATSHLPLNSFRGSLDHFQFWTRSLSADEISADYRTLGLSLEQPLLRYTFDEGSGELAPNNGTETAGHLLLGQNPDGQHYFNAGLKSYRYTSPVWAPSQLPLSSDAASWLPPIIETYQAGRCANVSVRASAQVVRLASLPSHGHLLLNGIELTLGEEVPSGAIVTFVAASGAAEKTSFTYQAIRDNASAHGIVYLLPDAAPTTVPDLSPCTWPLGSVQCTAPQLEVVTREDTPVTILLIGRSPYGTDRTTAVISHAPTSAVRSTSSCPAAMLPLLLPEALSSTTVTRCSMGALQSHSCPRETCLASR